jgi:hypothetical protein
VVPHAAPGRVHAARQKALKRKSRIEIRSGRETWATSLLLDDSWKKRAG